MNLLPHFTIGKVVKGFGRGSKTLGIPTANFEQSVVDRLPAEMKTGVYFGWAKVNDSAVYEMVTSIGWNPYFKNQLKSMETYIMHEFSEDFYGAQLKICLGGYIRDEMDFNSIDELKAAIQSDVEKARQELQNPIFKKLSTNEFFNTHQNGGDKI